MASKFGLPIPKDTDERIRRGRTRNEQDASLRRECFEFWRGNQYVYRDKANFLVEQGTVQGTKEPYRVRQAWNLLTDPVNHEVSASTKRIPQYEVTPSTRDPDKVQAAKMSEKVALYGYDKWRMGDVAQRVVTNAVVADEGFAQPYWDSTVGVPIGDGVCEGEVRIRTFTANEVFWEPGVKFMDSRWHCIEQARPIDEVNGYPGLLDGVKLEPDATTRGIQGEGKQAGNLVLVTEYLERPTPKNEKGRRLIIANDRVICEPEDYPCLDSAGAPLDEPCLHYLTRIIDPDSDRGKGLIRFCLDPQRTYNDCTNKIIEWKNLALNPQVILKNMVLKQRLTDEPGKVYQALGSGDIMWRPVPPIPQELFQMREEAKGFVQSVFSMNDIPSGVEAGKAIQVLIERDDSTREGFTARLADFHSRLMRHCLYLVQRYYSERRQLKLKGMFGWESLQAFKGADLRSECDVTVLPGSIEPRTKASVEQRVMNYAQLGWITPEKAMAAIDNGTAEGLIDDYELDVAKAYRQIRKLEALANGAPGADVPIANQEIDNADVMLAIMSTWMKTEEWEMMALDPNVPATTNPATGQVSPGLTPMGEASSLLVQQYKLMQQQAMMEQVQQQNMAAEQAGMDNASGPQAAKPNPSLPALPENG